MEQDRRHIALFNKSITLGNIITIFTLGLGGVGVYTQIYADVKESKVEVVNIKQQEARKTDDEREYRRDVKDAMRDMKNDIRQLNDKLDRVLLEIGRIPKPPARRDP